MTTPSDDRWFESVRDSLAADRQLRCTESAEALAEAETLLREVEAEGVDGVDQAAIERTVRRVVPRRIRTHADTPGSPTPGSPTPGSPTPGPSRTGRRSVFSDRRVYAAAAALAVLAVPVAMIDWDGTDSSGVRGEALSYADAITIVRDSRHDAKQRSRAANVVAGRVLYAVRALRDAENDRATAAVARAAVDALRRQLDSRDESIQTPVGALGFVRREFESGRGSASERQQMVSQLYADIAPGVSALLYAERVLVGDPQASKRLQALERQLER